MPADLTAMDPGMDTLKPGLDAPGSAPGAELPNGETDREGAMAKADLYKLANYSHKLFQQIQDEDQLEGWVQAKITKAADYIASVYHYLEYEMKFSEYGKALDNSDVLSESQKAVLKSRLMEAKSKMKDLKKAQAEKMKDKVEEGILSGGERPCTECGGTGMVYEEPKPVPAHVKGKVEKYKRLTKATHAAHKRLDANNNGIPDDEEMEEGFGDTGPKEMKTGDTKKTRTGELTKTATGVVHKNTSYADDGEAEQKSGKGIKTHAKAKDAETKKAERGNDIKLPKHSGNTWGMKNGEKFGKKEESVGQGVYEAKKAKKDYDGDGKIESGKDEYLGSRIAAAKKAGKLKECGAGCECDKCQAMKESAKPSAGLSKAKKSATVKDAKAGKDIGKPGKGFDKIAKKAGGGEKGEKIAAAAMWKNIKETTAYIEEKKAAVKDLPGKQEKLDVDKDGKLEKSDFAALRAGKKAKETVKESTEVSRLRELTGRLNVHEKTRLNENDEVNTLRKLSNFLKG